MDNKEFRFIREKLEKTQKEIGDLLGTSLKSIQSFEQGWRKVPPYIERQLLFLVALKSSQNNKVRTCWAIRHCSENDRQHCPAWEFQVGHLCWFINGTICRGKVQTNWQEKMKLCRQCEAYVRLFKSCQLGACTDD